MTEEHENHMVKKLLPGDEIFSRVISPAWQEHERNMYPFPIPHEILKKLRDFCPPSPTAWELYSNKWDEPYFDPKEEFDAANFDLPWCLDVIGRWHCRNQHLIKLLSEPERHIFSSDGVEESVFFCLVQAFRDLSEILRVAYETWKHDPAFYFVELPPRQAPERTGNEAAGNDNNVVNLK